MKWHSVHIYLHEKEVQDKFIQKFLPIIINDYQSEIECWFYIRYWEGGPHIRLRIKTSNNIWSNIMDDLSQWINKHKFKDYLTRELFYTNNRFDGIPLDAESLPWYNNGTLVQIPYIPEYERYGGKHVISYCESIFQISSELNIQILNTNEVRKKDLSVPLCISYMKKMLLYSNIEDKYFYRKASQYWKTFDDGIQISPKQYEILNAISDNVTFGNEVIDRLKYNIKKIYENVYFINKEYYIRILLSLSHMHYNRGMVIPSYEYAIYTQFFIRELS